MWNYLTQDVRTYLTKHQNSYALNPCCSFLVLMFSQCPMWSHFVLMANMTTKCLLNLQRREQKHSVGKSTGGCAQLRSTAFYKLRVWHLFWLLFRQLLFALLKHTQKRQILGKIWFVFRDRLLMNICTTAKDLMFNDMYLFKSRNLLLFWMAELFNIEPSFYSIC